MPKRADNSVPAPEGSIGAAIRRIRLEKGLSQEDLAARLNTTQAQVSRWERITKAPHEDVLVRIATALGVSPSVFYEETRFGGVLIVGKTMRENLRRLTPEQLAVIDALLIFLGHPASDDLKHLDLEHLPALDALDRETICQVNAFTRFFEEYAPRNTPKRTRNGAAV